MEREKTVCFTGHRIIPAAIRPALLSELYSTVMRLIMEGYDSFICGGAVGFDTMAAECVLSMRERYPDIKLILALPCRDQTLKWDDLDDLTRYKEILGKADRVEYAEVFYSQGCMHKRNRWMVDHSSVCIAYLTSNRGGTAYTCNYANKSAVELINLGEKTKEVAQMTFV